MPTDSGDRWMPTWLALVRTHTRLWDLAEAQMRRDHGLTMARYDVLAHLDMAGGRLGDRKSTRLNSSHRLLSRMPSSA